MAAQVEHLEGTDLQKSRAYSPAVVTQGGRTIWLAGQTTTVDESGKDISGNFEAQARTVFALMDRTIKRAGASPANLITMEGFRPGPRYGARDEEDPREYVRAGS